MSARNEVLIRGKKFDARIEARKRDLASLDDPELFAGRHLVTASALLDLVSESWLRTLATRCSEIRGVALFSITYNGQSASSPAEPEDEAVLELFNQHQHRDKGLGGPAAGPNAFEVASRCFAEVGYEVNAEASDWLLGPDQGELQRHLIEGWASAAAEISPSDKEWIEDWRRRRIQHVEAGRSRTVVGHDDLAAWLPE